MARRTAAELAIDVVTNAADAVAGFDDVGGSADRMSKHVADAGRTAESTSRQIGLSADAADELGGKAGKATGALGALSSGFELVGAGKYAAGLQGAALATDFFSGVGDSLNLVMESTILKTARARVAWVANTIATGAQTVATAAQTAAQWALNAAMNASPVLIIVAGVLLLVGAIVLAYKRSETFRNIVQGAFKAVQKAASAAFSWIRSNWPLLLAIITGPIGLAVLAVVKNWDKIQSGAKAAKDFITGQIGQIPDAISGFASRIKSILLAPFNAVEDAIDKILNLIKKIKIPDIPGIPGLRTAGGSGTVGGGTTTNYFTITVQGAIDPYATAQQIVQLLGRYGITLGSPVIVP